MALSSGLSLWLYPYAITSTPAISRRNYRSAVIDLQFTTADPGGYGTLTATLNIGAKYLSRPEFQLFARVELMAQGFPCFLGEISEITFAGSGVEETIKIQALGVGNWLRDDPANFSYSAQTAKQIVTDQFTVGSSVRAGYNPPISFDLSQVFADNPATQYTLSYSWRTMEEIINDVCTLAGGYTWSVYESRVRDAFGFLQGQLRLATKDTTTTHYIVSLQKKDAIQYDITQTSERAYNIITVGYNEPSSGAPSFVVATDSRLTGTGGIGTAPFRRRKFNRELSGNSSANSTNATTVANQLLSTYKSGGSKVTLKLATIRDYNNAPLPLYLVRAGQNVHVPDLAGRGAQAPTGAAPGVNQFYILQTTYQEDKSGATLTLTCDNYTSDAEILIARLQYMAERMARTGSRTTEMLQGVGAAVKQWANGAFIATAGAQTTSLQGTTFRPILYQAPSSISWSAATYQVNNTGSPGVNNLNQYGFNAFITSTAGGSASYGGNYTTVGNCIYNLDLRKGTFDHHHGACGLLRTGLKIKDEIRVVRHESGVSMQIECPCGGGEAYNLDLSRTREHAGPTLDEGREYNNSTHDAEQARNIRALMRHGSVGLHDLVRDCGCRGCRKTSKDSAPGGDAEQVTADDGAVAIASADDNTDLEGGVGAVGGEGDSATGAPIAVEDGAQDTTVSATEVEAQRE